MTKVRTKIVAFVVAAMLALAMPMAAFAVEGDGTDSPSKETVEQTVSAMTMDQATKEAAEKALSEAFPGVEFVACYAYEIGDFDHGTKLISTLTGIDAQYNGMKADWVVVHEGIDPEKGTETVENSSITIETNGACPAYVGIPANQTAAKANTGDKSPKTGVDFGFAAGIAVVAIAAAGTTLALRKTMSK